VSDDDGRSLLASRVEGSDVGGAADDVGGEVGESPVAVAGVATQPGSTGLNPLCRS